MALSELPSLDELQRQILLKGKKIITDELQEDFHHDILNIAESSRKRLARVLAIRGMTALSEEVQFDIEEWLKPKRYEQYAGYMGNVQGQEPYSSKRFSGSVMVRSMNPYKGWNIIMEKLLFPGRKVRLKKTKKISKVRLITVDCKIMIEGDNITKYSAHQFEVV
jgi:hypothetical protein